MVCNLLDDSEVEEVADDLSSAAPVQAGLRVEQLNEHLDIGSTRAGGC